MRLKILFNLFILGICVAACSENDQPVSPQAESYVNFLSENSSTTKATDTQFETGDRISVFATTDGNIYRENYANNIAYTYLNGRFIPTGEGIALEDERTSLYYYAIYPYLQIADYNWGNAFAFQVQSDQSAHSGYTNSDLMLAYTDQASSASLIPLKFNHQLSKIVINTVNFASSDLTITLSNVYTNVMVNLNDRSVTSSTNRKSTVTLGANGTNSYRAIIPPQTIERDTQLATVTQSGNRYSVVAPRDITFSPGTQTTLTFVLNQWNEVDVYVGDYEPEEETDDRLDDVVPEDIQNDVEKYMPIYRGTTPPNIEGGYFMDETETVYCEDQGHGGFDPGHIVESVYMRFLNQNMTNNTLDYQERSEDGTSILKGDGAFISGSGNNFTMFFNATGTIHNVETRTALVVSGTKTDNGIQNLYYVLIMVEKGEDPLNQVMNEGVFRIFKDADGLAINYNWTANTKFIPTDAGHKFSMFSKTY